MEPHAVSKHQCGVNGCNKGVGKLCLHVRARCTNCQGNHQANSARCPSRQKAEALARKNKAEKELKAAIVLALDVEEEEGIMAGNYQEMDMEGEKWPPSPGQESSFEPRPETHGHTQDY